MGGVRPPPPPPPCPTARPPAIMPPIAMAAPNTSIPAPLERFVVVRGTCRVGFSTCRGGGSSVRFGGGMSTCFRGVSAGGGVGSLRLSVGTLMRTGGGTTHGHIGTGVAMFVGAPEAGLVLCAGVFVGAL